MISGPVLRYLNGSVLVILERYEAALPCSSKVPLTVPAAVQNVTRQHAAPPASKGSLPCESPSLFDPAARPTSFGPPKAPSHRRGAEDAPRVARRSRRSPSMLVPAKGGQLASIAFDRSSQSLTSASVGSMFDATGTVGDTPHSTLFSVNKGSGVRVCPVTKNCSRCTARDKCSGPTQGLSRGSLAKYSSCAKRCGRNGVASTNPAFSR